MAISYRQAGVDIDAGDELVRRIKPLSAATRTPWVLADVGGFAGLCGLPTGMKEPVLVSGTDGVGTKLKLAFAMNVHHSIGQDLVAMCVNDVITTGATPLFFLDYFATSQLNVDVAEEVVLGIAKACRMAGCALLGGETAELPQMYHDGEYDLAGFTVGVVDREKLIDGSKVVEGDQLVALPSSGLHSNGYSLARRVLLEHAKLSLDSDVPELGTTLGQALLTPTKIYQKAVAAALKEAPHIHAMAHITGGGITGNLPRVFPDGIGARIATNSWKIPPLFEMIAREGPVEESEMWSTFNLGVGYIMVVSAKRCEAVLKRLCDAGETPWVMGEVISVDPEASHEERVVRELRPWELCNWACCVPVQGQIYKQFSMLAKMVPWMPRSRWSSATASRPSPWSAQNKLVFPTCT
jgi:phosphoribosylformylglycinamidine cyclo-ligase